MSAQRGLIILCPRSGVPSIALNDEHMAVEVSESDSDAGEIGAVTTGIPLALVIRSLAIFCFFRSFGSPSGHAWHRVQFAPLLQPEAL